MDYREHTEITLLRIKAERRWSSRAVTMGSLLVLLAATAIYSLHHIVDPVVTRPLWFQVSTYMLLTLAATASTLLCWRNSRTANIPSGQLVWQCLLVGAGAGTLAQILALFWEQGWGLRPDLSLADPFFVLFYLGHLVALVVLIQRQKLLFHWQRNGVVIAVATGVVIWAWHLVAGATYVAPVPSTNAHPWGVAFIAQYQHLAQPISLFYIFADAVLMILATVLSLSFWGGRLASAWQVMAQGLMCIGVADIWFAYAAKESSYQSGDLMELFWLAGLLQLAIAAALEWENADRVQRLIGR
jgi:hypothetical protein